MYRFMQNKYLTWRTLFGTAAAALVLALMGPTTPVFAQSGDASQVSENDKAMYYSLYYEDYKNENYKSALPNIRWILVNAPEYPRKNDVNYDRLREIYVGLSKKAEDEATKRAYLDSALVVFETAPVKMKELGLEFDEVIWTINRGRFIQSHEQLQDRLGEVPEIYLQAYQLAPERVDGYYVKVVIDDYVRKDKKQEAIDLMDAVEERFKEDADMMAYITAVRDNLFKTPEERMAFLETRLEKDPQNVEIMAELFDIYLKLSQRGKAAQLGQRLSKLEPSAKVYQLLAKMHLEDGEAQQAFELYQKALELPGGDEKAREIFFNMGIAQQQLGRLSNARTYFRKAIEKDPKFGQAYLAIGDLYATSVQQCGGTLSREDRAVYWLVVDQYERARAADPSVASQAASKIGTYRRYFPSAEDMFFMSWKAGQSWRVDYGCYSWIGETTTMKSP